MERRKRRKVKDAGALSYYKPLFTRHLQGRELSGQLIDYIVNHESKWLRNMFQRYTQYLYYKRRISSKTFD